MTDTLDVKAARDKIVANLADHGFLPRDADGADFQFHDDMTLRFKVGTVYGEVAVTVWKHDRQMKDVIRVFTEAQIVEANHRIDGIINDHFTTEERNEGPGSDWDLV